MLKISKLLFPFFILISFFSCENETIDNPVQPSSNLISIKQSLNQQPVTNFVINNSLNTQIIYDGGGYNIQQFSGGLMVLSNFYDQNDNLYGKQEFQYDASNRLISKSSYSIELATTILNDITTFVYSGNEISSTKVRYNPDGSIEFSEQSNIFTLNSNSEISKFEDFNFGGVWEATYANGNLATVVVSGYGNKDGSGTFNYTDELASEPYKKEKFRFGPQWKTNIMLHNQVGGYAFKQLAELGANYLSGYSHVASDGSNVVSLEVDYEFDAQERLIKQTKNKIFYTSTVNIVLTYQYE